jgi:hypothetical protein
MEDTPTPPPLSDPSSMDVPSMLSILEEEGFDISRLSKCRGRSTVERAYKNFCAYRESQSQALVAHSPSKEMATANDDGSEKEGESAGGRYVFILLTYFLEVINIVFGQATTKTCGCHAQGHVRNEYRRVVNAYCVNILRFYSVAKKRDADPPTKKAKATDPPTKKAKAAGLSSKAKAAKAAGVEVISKQIIKYVHIVPFGKVINITVSEILKKQAFLPKKTE